MFLFYFGGFFFYHFMYELLSLFFVGDRPLIVQFAASNAKDFADAAEIVAP